MFQANGLAPQTFDSGSGYMRAGVADDPKMFVCFVTHAVHNHAESAQQGRPIFEGKPYIRIERAGERDVLMREASEEDKRRFREQWQAYQENREQMPAGTPLATLFPQHPEVIATLHHYKVKTVEQLAALSDTGKQTIGLGAHEWQQKAIELLNAAQGAQGYHVLKQQLEMAEATNAKLTARLAALEAKVETKPDSAPTGASPEFLALLQQQQEQIAVLAAKVEQTANLTPVRRGRPPKVKPETQEIA